MSFNYIILYYTILYSIILYYTMLYCILLYYSVLYDIVLHYIIYYVTLGYVMAYCIIWKIISYVRIYICMYLYLHIIYIYICHKAWGFHTYHGNAIPKSKPCYRLFQEQKPPWLGNPLGPCLWSYMFAVYYPHRTLYLLHLLIITLMHMNT